MQLAFYENSQRIPVIAFADPPDFCAIPYSLLLQQPFEHGQMSLLNKNTVQKYQGYYQGIKVRYHRQLQLISPQALLIPM